MPPVPFVLPRVTVLLTGRYPIRSGLIFVLPAEGESWSMWAIRTFGRWNGKLGGVDVQDDCYVGGLPDEEITLGGALKSAGYKTSLVGKWHLGDFSKKPAYNPIRHGFDEFFGVPHANNMFPLALYRQRYPAGGGHWTEPGQAYRALYQRSPSIHHPVVRKPFFPISGPYLSPSASIRLGEIQR